MKKSYEIFEACCGVPETEKDLGLTTRLEGVLGRPDDIEYCGLMMRSCDSVKYLSDALQGIGLTLDGTPNYRKFRADAKLFGSYGSVMRDDGVLLEMRVVAFDAYNYESACTDSVYRDGSVVVFKSDTRPAGWFRTRPKLTTQNMEWGKNCAYVGHVTSDDVKWFCMSPKNSNDNEPNTNPFELKAVDLGDRKVDELYAELREFLRIRESL